ncbi:MULTISPECIES: hypothetical protein [Streptomyces]|uniref:hypothetical protein n=1 Tax=Streptomyces TaxID=1883 RepID=UPI0013156034|nr:MULTISPECIES: hypothetical protein [Streptomyces]
MELADRLRGGLGAGVPAGATPVAVDGAGGDAASAATALALPVESAAKRLLAKYVMQAAGGRVARSSADVQQQEMETHEPARIRSTADSHA